MTLNQIFAALRAQRPLTTHQPPRRLRDVPLDPPTPPVEQRVNPDRATRKRIARLSNTPKQSARQARREARAVRRMAKTWAEIQGE